MVKDSKKLWGIIIAYGALIVLNLVIPGIGYYTAYVRSVYIGFVVLAVISLILLRRNGIPKCSGWVLASVLSVLLLANALTVNSIYIRQLFNAVIVFICLIAAYGTYRRYPSLKITILGNEKKHSVFIGLLYGVLGCILICIIRFLLWKLWNIDHLTFAFSLKVLFDSMAVAITLQSVSCLMYAFSCSLLKGQLNQTSERVACFVIAIIPFLAYSLFQDASILIVLFGSIGSLFSGAIFVYLQRKWGFLSALFAQCLAFAAEMLYFAKLG